jgi:hypothetical protein
MEAMGDSKESDPRFDLYFANQWSSVAKAVGISLTSKGQISNSVLCY